MSRRIFTPGLVQTWESHLSAWLDAWPLFWITSNVIHWLLSSAAFALGWPREHAGFFYEVSDFHSINRDLVMQTEMVCVGLFCCWIQPPRGWVTDSGRMMSALNGSCFLVQTRPPSSIMFTLAETPEYSIVNNVPRAYGIGHYDVKCWIIQPNAFSVIGSRGHLLCWESVYVPIPWYQAKTRKIFTKYLFYCHCPRMAEAFLISVHADDDDVCVRVCRHLLCSVEKKQTVYVAPF